MRERPNLARSPLTWRDATRMRIEPNRWKSVPLSTPVIKRLLDEGREMRAEIDGRLRAMERAAHGPESRDRAY